MKRRVRPLAWVCGLAALIGAALMISAQTTAFTWDEGFHLLAAQLIDAGRKPYIDFCFPQTPLVAYWNAAWMRIFGETWRAPHAVSALLTAGAILLAAEFALRQGKGKRWGLAGALIAALFIGWNDVVFEFGPLGQAYGMCLFLTVAAFRAAVAGAGRRRPLLAGVAGLLMGAAAGSSLLTAAAAPVLLIWLAVRNRAGNRWWKSAAFVIGAAIPFLPVLRLYAEGPRQTIFNLFQYHLHYRVANWPNAAAHDWDVLTSWINSGPVVLMGLMAAAGLLAIRADSELDGARRSELYLCGWLALALGLEAATAHPTFERYFVFVVPFVGILAGLGFAAVCARLSGGVRPLWPVLGMAFLLAAGWARGIYDRRDVYTWGDMEQVAEKVKEVTPANAPMWTDEVIYFLTRRTPPPGMEFGYSHTVGDLSPQRAAELHILPRAELKRRVQAGAYSTVEACEADTEFFESLGLGKIYRKKAEVEECVVYWDRL